MKSSRSQTSISRNLVGACVLSGLLAGCTVVGPSSIRSGRLAYNGAITETNNQQMLMIAIQNRYVEREREYLVDLADAVVAKPGAFYFFGPAAGWRKPGMLRSP